MITYLKLEKIILVGLSNGGRVALDYACRFKNNLEAIVACDTYDVITPLLKAKLSSWLLAHEEGGPLHRFDIATPWIWGEEVFAKKSELILSYRDKADFMMDHVVRNLILGALETNIDVTKIDCPVLLLAGDQDLLTPVAYHELMKSKMKNAELAIVNSGHASLLEKPTIMEKTILPWIVARSYHD